MRNNTEKLVKAIRRRTRKKYSAEEKIRVKLKCDPYIPLVDDLQN